jgi:hypothetical protein
MPMWMPAPNKDDPAAVTVNAIVSVCPSGLVSVITHDPSVIAGE